MALSRKRKDRLRIIAAGGGFILLLPFMIAAAASVTSAETAVFFAASTSAFLTAGDIFPYEKNSENISDENNENQISEEIYSGEKNADKSFAAPMAFSVDDSEMLSYGVLEFPNSTDEERVVTDKSYDVGPEPYPESLESRDGIITSLNYGSFNGDNYINLDLAGQVRNITSVSNGTLLAESRLAPEFTIEKNGEPQILIMHTHTTESYEPYERDFYDSSWGSRTTDEKMNMVAVGDAIAEQLEAAGIGVIHDTTKHDYPSYNDSYDRSRVTVSEILKEYPSIKIVLDIHRDAIERSDGERIAPVAEINGRNAAQVMIINGCDDGTMDMPDYLKNFRFSSMLQQKMESEFPGLTRPILFDYRKYNQDLTTGSILIEVGGHANSIDQAVYSGELIGKALADCFE
ncbi:MAG: stage II sporulation protein P [Oscillospiraceae bacterium]|nr:stage II sporulation protein P [Oscillospiraceae bacterium]